MRKRRKKRLPLPNVTCDACKAKQFIPWNTWQADKKLPQCNKCGTSIQKPSKASKDHAKLTNWEIQHQPPKESFKKRRRVDYKAYIDSPAWAAKRRQVFAKYGRKCQECGSGANLHVHHKTYARLGNESLKDLKVLCADCHALEHEKDGIADEMSREYLRRFSVRQP